MVLLKEDSELQREWTEMKLQAEIALINVLRKHLKERVINPNRDKIIATLLRLYSYVTSC